MNILKVGKFSIEVDCGWLFPSFEYHIFSAGINTLGRFFWIGLLHFYIRFRYGKVL